MRGNCGIIEAQVFLRFAVQVSRLTRIRIMNCMKNARLLRGQDASKYFVFNGIRYRRDRARYLEERNHGATDEEVAINNLAFQ
jgi:hypothetical protein